MRPKLKVAPAMAPTAPVVATSLSLSSIFQFLRAHELEAKVIAAWVLWMILRHLQSILGPMRRRSGHWSVQFSAMAAYYLPTLVVFYTANAVYSSDSDNKVLLSMGCYVLLITCARGAVTMKAFTLGDGPLRLKSWRLLPWLLYIAWLQWGLIWSDRELSGLDAYYFIVLCVGPLLYVLFVAPKVDNLDHETKWFADYMVLESRSSSLTPFFPGDANGLYGRCRYPFMQLKEWITLSDVQQLRGLLMGECTVDPDSCLSYIFCRLLARRYFGFPCPEDGKAQVRDFVVTELLADCNRAFAIVEVQLALLHDYFFTNYHTKIINGMLSAKQGTLKVLLDTLLLVIGYAVGSLATSGLSGGGLSVDPVSGVIAVAAFLVYMVIRQPEYPVLPTYWHPIQHVIRYYLATLITTQDTGRPSDSPVTTGNASPDPCSRSQRSRKSNYWRNKIGQYSVIEDYDHRSYMRVFIAWCRVHVLSHVPYTFIRHHPAQEKDVDVSDSLRRFIAQATKEMNNGTLTMGTRSLGVYRDNGSLNDLSWTCRQETLTDTILIWHIATCYCDMSSEQLEADVPQPLQEWSMSRPLEEPSTGYREVATTLSKYCAYLVAFLPELLSEHSLTVKFVFQLVLQQPRDILGTTRMTMAEKRRRIQELHLPEDVSSLNTFQRGVRLGRQLEQQPDVSLRWKVMADFWAEMILYAASSDNAAAHIEQLAQGGEFVTHVWALRCNAGIRKPATEEWTQDPEAILSDPTSRGRRNSPP